MTWRPIAQFDERLQDSLAVSEDSYYHDLLLGQEFLLKMVVTGMVAAVEAAAPVLCRAMEQTCIRDNGLHGWSQVGLELTRGNIKPPDSHHPESARVLNGIASDHQRQLTQRAAPGSWEREVLEAMDGVRNILDLSFGALSPRAGLVYWMEHLHVLRNETKGHGGPPIHKRLEALPLLATMYNLLSSKLDLLQLALCYVTPTLPGRSVARPLSGNLPRHLVVDECEEGVHALLADRLVPLRLLKTDRACDNFFLPNGQFREQPAADQDAASYQSFSYSNGLKRRVDASRWVGPRPATEDSVTAGATQLFGDNNLPPLPAHYVGRPRLEKKLAKRLSNDSNAVVTLTGRGGIGKTTLALQVIHTDVPDDRYAYRIWLSARDVDLEDDNRFERPKRVRKQVATRADIATEFVALLEGHRAEPEDALVTMAQHLSDKSGLAPVLVVFDNFETVEDPVELFDWVEDTIRSPNKALITTRVEGFEGDYAIDVRGMEHDEFTQLVQEAAMRHHISEQVTDDYAEELFRETGGHPYVARVILAEAERTGKLRRPKTLMATKDEILDALFAAIYNDLNRDARRVFLMLARLKSIMPRRAVEAVLLRPGNEFRVDVDGCLDRLEQVSLIEQIRINEGQHDEPSRFVHTPMAVSAFAAQVWRDGTLDFDVREAVEADVTAAQPFGYMPLEEVEKGFEPRFRRYMGALGGEVASRGRLNEDELAMLEYICRHWGAGWVAAADLYEATGDLDNAIRALHRFVALHPSDWTQWKEIARLQALKGAPEAQARALIQGALASERPADRRAACLEAAAAWLELVRKHDLAEPMTRRNTARQLLEALSPFSVEYGGSDSARVVRLFLVGQQKDLARKYFRKAIERSPTNSQLIRLRSDLD